MKSALWHFSHWSHSPPIQLTCGEKKRNDSHRTFLLVKSRGMHPTCCLCSHALYLARTRLHFHKKVGHTVLMLHNLTKTQTHCISETITLTLSNIIPHMEISKSDQLLLTDLQTNREIRVLIFVTLWMIVVCFLILQSVLLGWYQWIRV